MSNFLKNNQKSDIRVNITEDIILYEPTKDQYVEIRALIDKQNLHTDNNLDVSGEIEYSVIRYIIRNCCKNGAFIDEYTDDELAIELDNGNKNVKKLINAIVDLIEEIIEDIQNETFQQIKLINGIINITNMNLDAEKTNEKMNKLFKKQGVNMTVESMVLNKDNPEKLQELMTKSKKKYNKSKK